VNQYKQIMRHCNGDHAPDVAHWKSFRCGSTEPSSCFAAGATPNGRTGDAVLWRRVARYHAIRQTRPGLRLWPRPSRARVESLIPSPTGGSLILAARSSCVSLASIQAGAGRRWNSSSTHSPNCARRLVKWRSVSWMPTRTSARTLSAR
jgi:hypothetical protein